MNRNQVEGAARLAAGKIQKKLGEAIGSARLEGKGTEKQTVGALQKAAGDMQAAALEADRKMLEDERRPGRRGPA